MRLPVREVPIPPGSTFSVRASATTPGYLGWEGVEYGGKTGWSSTEEPVAEARGGISFPFYGFLEDARGGYVTILLTTAAQALATNSTQNQWSARSLLQDEQSRKTLITYETFEQIFILKHRKDSF